MFNHKVRPGVWIPFFTLILIMACLPTFGAPPIASTPNEDEINTSTTLASTGQAVVEIHTFTPTPGPSVTPTLIVTETPNPTETETPVVTDTLTAIPFTPTTFISPTTVISSYQVSPDYACAILRTTPTYKTIFKPGKHFDANWLVMNVGRKKWDGDIVDYFYESGAALHTVGGYDLQDSLMVGRTREIVVEMVAPDNNGIYSTQWIFQVHDEKFCPLSLIIMVQE